MSLNSAILEPTRTVLITGFGNLESLEKYKDAFFNPETMLESYSVPQSKILFLMFYDLRDSVKFFNFFKKQNQNTNLQISYTISKFELPKKNEECSEKNKQSTIIFEFVDIDVKIEDNFIVNFLKQYGEVKELKGTSSFLKVIEFYSIKDAIKAFKALNGSPFATGEIQCKWDWDLTSSARVSYIKLTDEFIKRSAQAEEVISDQTKRYKPIGTSKNMFLELFDSFIAKNISEIEDLFE